MGDTCSPGRATAWGEDSHQFHCPSGRAPSGHRAMATAAVAASVTATVTAVAAAAAAGGESGLQPMQAVGGDGRQADAKHLRNRFQPQQQQHHKRHQPSQHHHQQQHPQLRQQQQQLERQQNTQQGFEHDQRGGQAAHPLALDSDPLKIQGQDVGGDSAPKRQRHHRHANNQGRGGGKRHRRKQAKQKRPRRWKPYTKLSWDEKRQLEERDARRAARIRAEMEAKGFPVAPYNTTQFLMEEHYLGEPDLKPPPTCRGHRHYHHGYHRRRRRRSSSCKTEDESSGDAAAALGSSSSSSGGCSGDEGAAWAGGDDAPNSGASDGGGAGGAGGGGDFLLKDFFETYERYHTESLNAMSKRELLQEYLELEKCLSRLQEENALLRLRVEGVQHGGAGRGGGGGGAHGSGGELGGRGGGHAEATAVACKGPIGGDGGASVDGGDGGGASDVKQDVSGAADGSGGSEDAGGDVGGGDRDDGHAGRVEGDADATEAGDGGGHEGPSSSSSSFPQPQVTCWTPQGSSEVTRIVQLESELQRLRADNAKLNRQHELLVQLASTGLGTEAQMA